MAETLMSFVLPATRQIQWLSRQIAREQLVAPQTKKIKQIKMEDIFSAHKQHVIRCFNCQGSKREKIKKINAVLDSLIMEVQLKNAQPKNDRLQIIKDFFAYLGCNLPEINQENRAEQLYIFLSEQKSK